MPGSAVLLGQNTQKLHKTRIHQHPNTKASIFARPPRDVFCQRFDEALHDHDAGIREGREELNGDAVAFHGEESFHDSRVGHQRHGVPT